MAGASDVHTSWYRALTLEERIASLRNGSRSATGPLRSSDDQGKPRWIRGPVFANPSTHTRRLQTIGITQAEFDALLDESIDCVRSRVATVPSWLADLDRAFARHARAEPLPLAEQQREHPMAGLLNPVHPLLIEGVEALRSGVVELVQRYGAVPFDPETIDTILFASLANQILRMTSRTAALEVNVMRLEGLLQGDTAEQRFREFTDALRRPERLRRLWQEYPVLARQVTICIRQWTEASTELLGRLCADWETLRETLSPETDPGVLSGLTGDSGDRHRDGRRVRVLEFTSGLRIVYKPKSMALPAHFQDLLQWINDRSDHLSFRTAKVVERGSYGWMEFIKASPCASRQEVERFYQRQGGYLALLYAIEAADFHAENLIAAGEHPVLIDLEALFHPREARGQDLQAAARNGAAFVEGSSVRRVGLLPFRLYGGDSGRGMDLSGWGGAAGQVTPFAVPVWEAIATDEMHLERRQMPVKGSLNRPSFAGADVDLSEFADEIVDGFSHVYRLLMEHREALALPRGFLNRFSNDELRVILRPTRTYALLLEESFHPDLLRDALDRDLHFDRLWFAVDQDPARASVIAAERHALQNGDIPFFTTEARSVHLWSGPGERIDDFFAESGLAAADRRLKDFDEHDLERQVWYIRAALAAAQTSSRRSSERVRLTPAAHVRPPALFAAACAIGDRLERLAIRSSAGVEWLGLIDSGQGWDVGAIGLDLYDGVPGIALFLGYLGALAKEDRYTVLSRGACDTMRRTVKQSASELTWTGAFVGWGGIIYTLTHLGVLWREDALLDEAEGIAEVLPALIDKDEQLDIIGGTAGCLGALLALHGHRPAAATLAAAMRCGDRLISTAKVHGAGLCWDVPRLGPLGGFAHGAAGMSWALFELYARTGEDRFRDAACRAVVYERSLFSPEAGNWRDLRDATPSFPVAWCHGAAGIGLSRLAASRCCDDRDVRADLETALKTTAVSFGNNHSLCHGDFGNLELLVQSGDTARHDEANRIVAAILERGRRDGWRCGTPMEVESPGLMTGLAGIGYGLLRVADPARTPCVLVLEGTRD